METLPLVVLRHRHTVRAIASPEGDSGRSVARAAAVVLAAAALVVGDVALVTAQHEPPPITQPEESQAKPAELFVEDAAGALSGYFPLMKESNDRDVSRMTMS